MDRGFYLIFLFILIGGLFVALGIPLKQGRVGPNRFYGFRTPRTLSDENVWYPANRVLGIDMMRGGVAIIVVSLTMLAFRGYVTSETAVMVMVATIIATALFMAIHGFAILKKL